TPDRGQQALHLMLVGDHAGASGLGLDTGLFRDVRSDDRAGDFIRYMTVFVGLGSVVGGLVRMSILRRLVWLATAGCEEQGQREYRDQVDRLHGVAPWLSCGSEPATNAWPVSRWISTRARWASSAASSCCCRAAACSACRLDHSR